MTPDIGDPLESLKAVYEPTLHLGEGASSYVFLAIHRSLRRKVVVKLSKPSSRFEPARFRREATLLAQIDHPAIMKIFDFGMIEDRSYLVFPYVPGRDLGEVLKEAGTLCWRRVLPWVVSLSEGLACIHAMGIVHRDIKPGNIWITDSGNPMLLDFGLASQDRLDRLTRTGCSVGTPCYASPEQILDGTIDARSDVYSLGVVVYALLTGRNPFQGKDFADTLNRQSNLRLTRIDSPGPIPEALESIVLRLLAKRPEARPRDGAELLELLAGIPPFGTGADAGSGNDEASQPPFQRESLPRTETVMISPRAAPLRGGGANKSAGRFAPMWGTRRAASLAVLLLAAGSLLTGVMVLPFRGDRSDPGETEDPQEADLRFSYDEVGSVRIRGLPALPQGSRAILRAHQGLVLGPTPGSDWSFHPLPPDTPFEVDVIGPQGRVLLAGRQGRTPAALLVENVQVVPMHDRLFVSFDLPAEGTVDLLVTAAGKVLHRFLESRLTRSVRREIVGLVPDRQYQLWITRGGFWGGVQGLPVRTRAAGSYESVRELIDDLRGGLSRDRRLDLLTQAQLWTIHDPPADTRLLQWLERLLREPFTYEILIPAVERNVEAFLPPEWGDLIAGSLQRDLPAKVRHQIIGWLALLRHPAAYQASRRWLEPPRDNNDLKILALSLATRPGPSELQSLASYCEAIESPWDSTLESMLVCDPGRARSHMTRWLLGAGTRVDLRSASMRVLACMPHPDPIEILDRAHGFADDDPRWGHVLELMRRLFPRLSPATRQSLRDRLLKILERSPRDPEFLAVAAHLRFDEVRTLVAERLVENDPSILADAIVASGHLLDPANTSRLVELLDHTDSAIRRRSAWALGRLQASDAIGPLEAMVRSSRDDEGLAAWALGEIGSKGSLAVLMEKLGSLLEGTDQPSPCRIGLICWSLGRLRAEEARELLVRARNTTQSPLVRWSSDVALGALESGLSRHVVLFPFLWLVDEPLITCPGEGVGLETDGYWLESGRAHPASEKVHIPDAAGILLEVHVSGLRTVLDDRFRSFVSPGGEIMTFQTGSCLQLTCPGRDVRGVTGFVRVQIETAGSSSSPP